MLGFRRGQAHGLFLHEGIEYGLLTRYTLHCAWFARERRKGMRMQRTRFDPLKHLTYSIRPLSTGDYPRPRIRMPPRKVVGWDGIKGKV